MMYCTTLENRQYLAMMEKPKEGSCEGDWGRVLQEIPQLNYTMEYVTTYLQKIPQRIR